MSTILTISQCADLMDYTLNSLYFQDGFNPAARTGTSDEYSIFNRKREQQYAREDKSYQLKMRVIELVLAICVVAMILKI